MKGRIIGREGRNIRAFEATTGVNLIIDDTPEAVVLSCFDPVRREAARMTLAKLVEDGRIHPARIEEIHERSLRELEEQIKRAGEDAVAEVGITDIHPELIKLLGRLQYRTSYGQNVLRHLVESAYIASALAAEIGLDPTVVKRGAFLHDVGKAVTHEVEGSHAIIGAEIARRLKARPRGRALHRVAPRRGGAAHDRCRPCADRRRDQRWTSRAPVGSPSRPTSSAWSASRRSARPCPGVEKTFAMQAGREVRVMVKPEDVDDIQAQDRPRYREAGRGGAAVPGSDQDHGGAGNPRGGVREVGLSATRRRRCRRWRACGRRRTVAEFDCRSDLGRHVIERIGIDAGPGSQQICLGLAAEVLLRAELGKELSDLVTERRHLVGCGLGRRNEEAATFLRVLQGCFGGLRRGVSPSCSHLGLFQAGSKLLQFGLRVAVLG